MVNFRDIYFAVMNLARSLVKDLDHLKVFVPQRREHGDISTNLAILISKKSNNKKTDEEKLEQEEKRISPKEAFDSVSEAISKLEYVEKVDFAAGFCNMTMSKQFLKDGLVEILLKGKSYGQKDKNGLRVNVEYISANPTGHLHLGHTRGIYADTVANLLSFSGWEVTKEYLINDVGNQIDLFARSIFHEYAKLVGIEFEKPDDGYPGEHIAEIAQKIYDEHKNLQWESDYEAFSELCIDKSILYIKEDLDFIKIRHDVWTSEKWLQKNGWVDKAIAILEQKGLVTEGLMGEIISGKGKKSEVPVKIFRHPGGEKALTKENGSFTYFASDLGYHYYKISRGFDWMMDFFGADHGGQLAPLEYGVAQLGGKKFSIILCQSVAYTSDGIRKKFSKRKGNTIRPKDLEIDSPDLLRFLMTAKNIDTHYTIDLDDVSKISESGFYYIQYANARCNSILQTAKQVWPDFDLDFSLFEAPNLGKSGVSASDVFDSSYRSSLSGSANSDVLAGENFDILASDAEKSEISGVFEQNRSVYGAQNSNECSKNDDQIMYNEKYPEVVDEFEVQGEMLKNMDFLAYKDALLAAYAGYIDKLFDSEDLVARNFRDDPFMEMISLLLQWPLEVEMCSRSLSIPQIHAYMQKIASKLHNLWTLGKGNPKLRFIIESEKEISIGRLIIVKGISHVLSAGFRILGITAMKQV